MAIIGRRIPHGLEGAESCGPDQQWDPNYVYAGIKGQCIPRSQALVKMATATPSFFDSFMSAFSTPQRAAAPTAPIATAAPRSGMSQNTMIAIGLGAVGLIAIVMLTRK
jgi:hypothetical protein